MGAAEFFDRFRKVRMDGHLVSLGDDAPVVPASCACCGQVAAESRAEVGPRSRRIIIPYCSACLHHVAGQRTRVLAVTLASVLAAATVAVALPLALPGASTVLVTLGALAAAGAPVLVGIVLPGRPQKGHAAAGRSVWWEDEDRLFCASPQFGIDLANENDLPIEPALRSESRRTPWMLAGPLLAVVAAPSWHYLMHPVVRVVNHSDRDLVFVVDGEWKGAVPPTAGESPSAGVELRLPAGQRRFELRHRGGAAVASNEVTLVGGAEHLYAPTSQGLCFWVETTHYGRAGAGLRVVAPLPSENRFWVLRQRIDTWFAPNPDAEALDRRSSGGALAALRQAPCIEAPESVRSARVAEP